MHRVKGEQKRCKPFGPGVEYGGGRTPRVAPEQAAEDKGEQHRRSGMQEQGDDVVAEGVVPEQPVLRPKRAV